MPFHLVIYNKAVDNGFLNYFECLQKIPFNSVEPDHVALTYHLIPKIFNRLSFGDIENQRVGMIEMNKYNLFFFSDACVIRIIATAVTSGIVYLACFPTVPWAITGTGVPKGQDSLQPNQNGDI